MDMNFPHPKRQREQIKRNGDYAVIVAAAVARQMAGITTHAAVRGSHSMFAPFDPIGARMRYFSSAGRVATIDICGSFLPQDGLEASKVNKISAEIYPDASGICKPCLLEAGSPEQPVASRGMEN